MSVSAPSSTVGTPGKELSPNLSQSDGRGTAEPEPSLAGDLRPLVPKLGLRDYWYPAVSAKKVGWRRPVQVRMVGEELCFFRAKDGRVVAIQDVCPHRGARISEGHCHYRGTVACPYHGWVFDDAGKNLAVLSEGPDSGVCGKPGTSARVYPTRELKGVVFVWIGDGQPAPIEEDVPEEFFDPRAYIAHGSTYWPVNYEVALENSMDSHVNYLHRDALIQLMRPTTLGRGAQGERPVFTGNGFSGDVKASKFSRPQPPQDEYPELGWTWPKHRFRRWWAWLFSPVVNGAMRTRPPVTSARWATGHRLPGMFRSAFWLGMYTRQTVPVEDNLTRLWYFHYVRPANWLDRIRKAISYYALHKWLILYNFSQQDASVMLHQRYDRPKLSGTDAEVVQWRKLLVTKHLGGRDAPFQYHNPEDWAPEDVPLERIYRWAGPSKQPLPPRRERAG